MAGQGNPVIFVHGYSDSGASWRRWQDILHQKLGIDKASMHTCTYVSLDNAISIKDIAEAFDRALAALPGFAPGQPFDAVVHSTGMLVLRAWLAVDPLRGKRLKRLIALAPATFGSPLAKQGRSWLGAIFKGSRQLGPDFLQAGDEILLELELASQFTWRLAENDLIADPARYDGGADTPWVFVFCGTGRYSGLRGIVNKPGTDGTVRRAGCGMNVRLIELDMTQSGSVVRRRIPQLAAVAHVPAQRRVFPETAFNVKIPVHLVGSPAEIGDWWQKDKAEVNHATILSDPPDELVELVVDALEMTDPATAPGGDPAAGYDAWLDKAGAESRFKRLDQQFQQFIVHAVDERGDPITDYNLQLYRTDGPQLEEFDAEVDVYGADPSYRCFHVDVASLLPQSGQSAMGLTLRIVASSGTIYVAYLGNDPEAQTEPGSWDASLSFDGAKVAGIDLFRPYTTTLIRLYLERQVLPIAPGQPAKLLTWDAAAVAAAAIV
jgi:pimeloyl-ACP methyl ester carboxylesterase